MSTIHCIAVQIATAVALVTFASGVASAQSNYPSRTVRIVIPVPPGGAADTLPRIVGEKLAVRWGQSVIADNRPGAALNLAADAVAKAAPDGHTLLATPPGPLVINQHISSKLPYDPAAFTPVTILASFPFVLVAGPSVAAKDLNQFIAHAKANPGKLTFGSPGVGSPPYLAAELLKAKAGIDLQHIPYRGMSPAFTDLLGGRLDMMFWDLNGVFQHVQSGQVRALGVGGDGRLGELPDVPAIRELVSGFEATTWLAMALPPGTDGAIASKIASDVAAIVKLPEVAQRFRDMHAIPVAGTPEQTSAFLRSESARWGQVIAATGVKAE